jgi:hypothetical protein
MSHRQILDAIKISIFLLGIALITIQPFFFVLASENVMSDLTATSFWKPNAMAKERYLNTSTSASFVWLFLVEKESGARMEIVTENDMAMFKIGRDIGLGEMDESNKNKWAKFMEEHEGKDVHVSSSVYNEFLHCNITGTQIPADLIGSEILIQEKFINRHFKKAPWGDTIPQKYSIPSKEALVFIKFCILQNLDVKRGCETGKLYLKLK